MVESVLSQSPHSLQCCFLNWSHMCWVEVTHIHMLHTYMYTKSISPWNLIVCKRSFGSKCRLNWELTVSGCKIMMGTWSFRYANPWWGTQQDNRILVSSNQQNYWLFVLPQFLFAPNKLTPRIILMLFLPLLMSKLSIKSIEISIKKSVIFT